MLSMAQHFTTQNSENQLYKKKRGKVHMFVFVFSAASISLEIN
jgi:hypothetical protein